MPTQIGRLLIKFASSCNVPIATWDMAIRRVTCVLVSRTTSLITDNVNNRGPSIYQTPIRNIPSRNTYMFVFQRRRTPEYEAVHCCPYMLPSHVIERLSFAVLYILSDGSACGLEIILCNGNTYSVQWNCEPFESNPCVVFLWLNLTGVPLWIEFTFYIRTVSFRISRIHNSRCLSCWI